MVEFSVGPSRFVCDIYLVAMCRAGGYLYRVAAARECRATTLQDSMDHSWYSALDGAQYFGAVMADMVWQYGMDG